PWLRCPSWSFRGRFLRFSASAIPPRAMTGASFNCQLPVLFPMPSASKPLTGRLFDVPIVELDPVDQIAVAAVGEPGARQFFLLASGSGRTLTLTCEKSQIQALLVRLQQMMAAQGLEGTDAAAGGSALLPGEPEWQVGEMGLGYHEERRMFVLVASEGTTGDEGASGEAPGVRFVPSRPEAGECATQARAVSA